MGGLGITGILPYDIRIKYNCVIVEGECAAVITIVNYDKVEFLKTINALLKDMKLQVSFHIKRQISAEFLKRLSSVIVASGSEIKSTNNNQIDNDILVSNKKEAEEIKKKIQIDDEQIYLVETYIKIYGESEEVLINNVKKLINSLYVSNITAKPCNFRQKESYISMLPILSSNDILSKYTEGVFTGDSLAMLFPFYTKSICDADGILLGKANNNMCKLNLLSHKNLNYNMCVFGSSGAGKSYYIKLNMLRNLYKGINQVIIDPEGEYVQLVENLGGTVYTVDTYNPLYIEENFATRNQSFFKDKIQTICEYLLQRYGYSVNSSEKTLIKEMYNKYGINENKESLYITRDNDNIYINNKYKEEFPTLNELLKTFNLDYSENDTGGINRFSNLTCIHIKSKSIEEIRKEMCLFFPKIYELITENTLIYFDEIWKCISMGKDKKILEEIYNMFKTLRKHKAGIIAISQDVGDLFGIDGGNFGKSILNNSHTKVFFKLEYSDAEKLNNLALGEELIRNRVFSLERGQAYIKQGNSCFTLQVIASENEDKLIKGDNIK